MTISNISSKIGVAIEGLDDATTSYINALEEQNFVMKTIDRELHSSSRSVRQLESQSEWLSQAEQESQAELEALLARHQRLTDLEAELSLHCSTYSLSLNGSNKQIKAIAERVTDDLAEATEEAKAIEEPPRKILPRPDRHF